MYRRPELYDAVYSFKDYRAESEIVHGLIEKYKKSKGNALLDVACGTGKHIEFLRERYCCEGLDLSSHLLKAAAARNPGIEFHEADMMSFDLGKWFDCVLCLFSAIGYTKTFEGLELAVLHMANHLTPGGVLVIEPWFHPEDYRAGTLHMATVDMPDYKVARINIAHRRGDLSVMEFHFLIGTPKGIESFKSKNELGLFTHAEYMAAFERAGLDPEFVSGGLIGRGLYIGVKPG